MVVARRFPLALVVLLAMCATSAVAGASFDSHASTRATMVTPFLAAASGCRTSTAVPHHAGQRPVRPRSVPPGPRACLFRVGARGWEPTIGLTSDGAVFFKGMEVGNCCQSQRVWRSKDGGRSWTDVGAPLEPAVVSDPYLTVDRRTDRIFAVDLIDGCGQVSFSDDEGASWTVSPHVCGEFDHETVFTGRPVTSETIGYPDVVYYCALDGGTGSEAPADGCLKSIDGGVTFTSTGSLPYPARDGCYGPTGHGVSGRDGSIYLPALWCGHPYLAISRDEGATWKRVRVAKSSAPYDAEYDVPAHEAAIAADGRGDLYYAWVARDLKPYLVVSKNAGRTWGRPMNIGPPGLRFASLPGIDAGAPGRIAVEYMGSRTDRWNGYVTISANVLSRRPLFYTTTVNAPRHPLATGPCGPARCDKGGDFFDVVIGPDGRAWAAFVDTTRSMPPGPLAEGVVGHLVGGPSLR